MAGATALLRSLDGSRLRAVSLTLRSETPTPRPHETDGSLVGRVEPPLDSVDDAFRRLRGLERRLRERDDRRAVFLTIYTRMTAAVRDAIAAGRFSDPDWMRRYTVAFADYYRRAF